jgi:hypothetical protein
MKNMREKLKKSTKKKKKKKKKRRKRSTKKKKKMKRRKKKRRQRKRQKKRKRKRQQLKKRSLNLRARARTRKINALILLMKMTENFADIKKPKNQRLHPRNHLLQKNQNLRHLKNQKKARSEFISINQYFI